MQNGSFAGNIACIDCSRGLQQHQLCLLCGDWAVFYSMRNDDEFALFHPDIALTLRRLADLHEQPPFDYEKEFILHIVMMPDKLSLHLDDLYRKVVEFPHHFRAPVLGEACKFLLQIDLFHNMPSFHDETG